jgi:hypothetical protein
MAEEFIVADPHVQTAEEIPLLLALSEGLTSQSRHSLALAGSPPSAKLLIPLMRLSLGEAMMSGWP